jgi:orotate phosphoribosyltransferase
VGEDTAHTTIALFREAGAFLEGHFLLTSGRHSGSYLEKFLVLQWPKYTEQLCRMIAAQYRRKGVQVVAGPTTGGVVLAYGVARHLGVRGIFAERSEDGRAFRRGFTINPGERVLVVDDVLTTGGSLREVVDEVRRLGGEIVGVAVLVDRSSGAVDFGVPYSSLLHLEIPTYAPEECPLCAKDVPLSKPGSSER